MSKQILFLAISLLGFSNIYAQLDGDNIFGADQIVTIELDFPEANFWTTLVSNYNADENEYIWADLTITDVTGVTSMDSVGVRLKGNSSYGHPGNKKSFKIDFNKFVVGQDYDGLKKLNFSNGFKDPAVIREKVFFDVCREAGVLAPRAGFANVYFNGELWGFYTIIEQIDDQFLDWAIEEDQGNLFKAGANFGGGPGGGGNAADLAYYGAAQSAYEERYELKTNEELNDWSDLIELVDFIDNSTTAEFEAGIESRLELTEYLRSAAIDNLFSNLDSYTGSARNYYIYHNQMTNRWEWIHWDGNESFGTYSTGGVNVLNLPLDYSDTTRPLLEQVFASEVLYAQYLDQICDLTENYFNSEYMDARIDVLKLLVQDAVYADDNKMYSNADFDTNIESNLGGGGGPGGGTTYGLKSFVASRSSNVSGQVDCLPASSLSEFYAVPLQIYPNPSRDLSIISWGDTEMLSIRLIDTLGRVIEEFGVKGMSNFSFETSVLPSGTYLLRFQNNEGEVRTELLIIE